MKKGQAVKPLRKNDIKKILNFLEEDENIILWGIVKFALNTGLRISDILLLKFEDINATVLTEKRHIKQKIFFLILLVKKSWKN